MVLSMQERAMTGTIRAARDDDAAAIAAIYNHYVLHTIVTFEEEPVPAEEMRDRVRETQAAGLPFLVAAPGGRRSPTPARGRGAAPIASPGR
jgi:hypothetical protein